MKVLVDGDAIPRPLKEVLFKIAAREKIQVVFVAASAPRLPESEYLSGISAGNAFNGADDWIVEHTEPGDIVITADIPLADRALAKGAAVLGISGALFTPANIKNAMAMRELLDELRVSGAASGGPPPFSERQRRDFINALDRLLQRNRP